MTKLRLAPALQAGDTIGIFAPASPVVEQQAVEAGLRLLKEAGFAIRYQTGLLQRRLGYLAGEDRARVMELHELWSDREIKALLALRGGYGSLRLLPYLDWNLLRSYPKMLIGFSDLTTLHAAFLQQTGICPLHGPLLNTIAQSDQESIDSFLQALRGKFPTLIRPPGLAILRPGQAQGPLLGGNLTCLNHLLATPWEPELTGAILLLEDVGEAPYRIDRLLTQLALAGRLAKPAAIIVGEFQQCGPHEEIWQRLLELTAPYETPLWANFPAGHGRRNLTLPLGAQVGLDSRRGELSLTRPA